MGFVEPLGDFDQVPVRLKVSCSTQFVEGGVHQTMAKPGEVLAILNVGAPATCTATGTAQKPPITEKRSASFYPAYLTGR
jgi:hypothetical protein